ncbi:response regulator transcription factor [Variovorax sp. J22R24]|uniref:response regulator transcription factor n=1 Tax=Variovorax gracilis TaxID=3053502 RepID=UPI002574EDCC|nr:response regulator transcription factor [Variovorax sp. J22R24]MDM0103323.1 response regulator transcription factor [Variovorax sp. J22R24]
MSIYVIDDHPLMRDAVSMVLRRVRPAANIVELDRLSRLDDAVVKHGTPDLVCLDLNLPDTTGCSGVITVKQSFSSVPLAVYSASPAADMEAQCLAHGADIYIDKASGATHLASSLRALLVDDVDGDTDSDEAPAAGVGQLTKRQRQLVQLIDEGLGNREMAQRLEISEDTVKVHMWRLYKRIGVSSRTQALHYARTKGLLAPQSEQFASGSGI